MPNGLRYNTEMISKSLIILIVICYSSIVIPSERDLKIAISSIPNSLDPLHATDANSQNINRLQYLSLVDTDEKMNIKCRACSSFEVSRNKNGEVINFSLRNDIFFNTGEKITAQSIYNSWKYYLDPLHKSVFKTAFEKIQKMEVLSETDLRIHYEVSESENLSNLVLLKIMKRVPEKIIGSGPYALENETPMNLRLKVDRSHFEVSEHHPEYMSFHVVRDETTLALRMLKQELDISTAQMSPRKEIWLLARKASALKVLQTSGTNTIYLGINHESQHLRSHNVRKAISHLIPRDLLSQFKLKDTAELSTGLYSKVFEHLYLNNDVDNYDPNLAHDLLQEAGYVLKSGYWTKDSTPLVLDWKATNNRSSLEIVEVLRTYLRKNGIDVNVTIQEWGTFSRSVRNGMFDIFMGQWVGLAGAEMLGFVFHSSRTPPNGANRGKYLNIEFDKLYDLGLAENDKKTSHKYFRSAHEVAINDYAYIQLWHPSIRWVARGCIDSKPLYSSGSFLGLLGIKKNCKD